MKTAELTGAALDWAVATAAGYPVISPSAPWRNKHGAHGLAQVMVADSKSKRACHYDFRPSESWGQGGPIIEANQIQLEPGKVWRAKTDCLQGPRYYREAIGPTALVAAMRCFVSSALGDEVEIPEELTTTDVRKL